MLARPLIALVLASCSPSTEITCRVDVDCASGACGGNGQCVGPLADAAAPPDSDVDAGDASDAGDAAPWDASRDSSRDSSRRDAESTDGGACLPDNDSIVTRSEVPLLAGLEAPFRVATDVDVNTAGEALGEDTRLWDLSGELDGDHDVSFSLDDPNDAWFRGSYPAATYVARIGEESELLGVFEATADALEMLAIVSESAGMTETDLEYSPPVTVLEFPFGVGDSWTTDSTVAGLYAGWGFAAWEDYAYEVDRAGELVTPFGTFQVVRVASTLTRTVGMVETTIRSFLFVAECFGTVAVITSSEDEEGPEFTHAAEVRRLAP